MGCFSSKMAGRTESFRGHAYLRSGRKGSHTLQNLLSSKTGGDPLLTLLYTGNAVVMKLKSQQEKEKVGFILDKKTCTENKFAESENPVVAHDVVDAWELMAGLDEEEQEDDIGSGYDSKEHKCLKEEHHEQKQSRYGLRITCGTVSDDGRLVQVEEICVDDFLSCSSDDGNEELDNYEELVAENCCKMEDNDSTEQSPSDAVKSEAIESWACTELDAVNIKDIDIDSVQFTISGGQFQNLTKALNSTKGKSRMMNATGEELQAFKAPSFRFRSVGDIRFRKEGGEHESVSGYSTPKFGCYVEVESVSGNFHDDLVAHLEEAMKQFTADEEHVLMTVVEEFLEQVQEDK